MEALNDRDEENGQVSGAKIKELLSLFHEDILSGVQDKLKALTNFHLPPVNEPDNSPFGFSGLDNIVPTYANGKYTAFTYAVGDSPNRKFWQVPKNFLFPKCDRRDGWNFWMLGVPGHTEKQADGTLGLHPIMPFRLMDTKFLPIKARNQLRNSWLPVFKIMDEAIVSGDSHPTTMTAAELNSWYAAGDALLKTRVAYCYVKPFHLSWGTGTWSKACLASEIKKNGTAEDISAIPNPIFAWSSKKRRTTKRKRTPKEIPRYPVRPVIEVSQAEVSVCSDDLYDDPPDRPTSPFTAEDTANMEVFDI